MSCSVNVSVCFVCCVFDSVCELFGMWVCSSFLISVCMFIVSKQFAMCLGVVSILLLNVMNVFSVCGGALLDRPYMVFQRVCVLCL